MKNEIIHTLTNNFESHSNQTEEGIEFCPKFKAEGPIFRELHLTLKPQIYSADGLKEGSLV